MALKTLCLFVLLFPAEAQVAQFENKPIQEIQFSPAQPLDPADLAHALPFKKGDPLDADAVATAIDNLFATGRFQDIIVEAEESDGGVTVRFQTQLTAFFGGLTVQGKIPNPPNRAQISSAAQLTLGAPFREEDLKHAQDTINQLLQSNGLYRSQVTPEVTHDETAQQIFLTIKIAGDKRAQYDTPIIEGDTKLPNATILKATGWRLPIIHWWRQVTALRTRSGAQGVLAAYQKRDRLKADVELKNLDYEPRQNEVRPTLDIDAGPRIKVTAVEASVSNRLLKRYVPVFEEHAVDNDLLTLGKKNLMDYFQGQGYYDVDVDFRVLPEQNDLQTIEYVISRGQRYRLEKISIVGNHYFKSDVIRERMYMTPASMTLRHGRYSQGFQQRDEESIADLYHANGFRDVKVTCVVERNYEGKAGQIAVTVRIDEGPQWMVDRLLVDGIQQADRKYVTSQLSSVAGEPFADVNVASDRDFILNYLYEQGFPDAAFKSQWAPSGKPQHADLTYTITEGNRKYVRRVITTGITRTRPSLAQKNITMKPGDPLSPVEETDIQKNLYDLGIFARVDTAIQNPDGDTDHKYVLYNFEEAKRYSLAVGLGLQAGRYGIPGVTSLSSPTGTVGASPLASVDLSRLNFMGVGQTVGLHLLYSFLDKRASVTYDVPRFLGDKKRTARFTVLYDDSLNVLTFASKREEASVQVSQKFSKALTGQFQFAYRRVSVNDVVIPTLLVPELDQPVRIGILTGNLVQDRRDSSTDPHHGIYNTLDMGLASTAFGSQRSFARISARNATYYQLTKSLVLARQTQFGVILPFAVPAGVSSQESIPLPERFFGGGPDTLRAFPYDQAGPRDAGASLTPGGPASQPTGFPLGGNALFYNNVEFRFPLIGANIGGVLFHDMGNVFSSLSDMSLSFHQRNLQDFNYTVHAVGFGLRYKTPVGPIRLDLAYSINPPSFIGFQGTPQQLLACNPALPPAGVCVGVPQSVSHFQFFFSIGQMF